MYLFIVKIRSALLVFITHKMALPILKMIRKPLAFPYTRQELDAMPADTLGKALANFLDKNNLELLPFYAKHDIKHILLSYEITDEGEGSLQCFMLGNGHISFPVLATVLYCFLTMPEHWHHFYKALRRGRRCPGISHWQWFGIIEQRVCVLQAMINAYPKKKNNENN